MTGSELIDIGMQAFAIGLVIGAGVGIVKSFLHSMFN